MTTADVNARRLRRDDAFKQPFRVKFLSHHTVKDHTSALYRKMKARNRAEAILRAQRLGLLA